MWILWEKHVIEDEKHFICSCSLYNDWRNSLYLKINYTQPEFQSMSVNDKFVYMLQNKQHLVAKFCHQAWSKRRQNDINNIYKVLYFPLILSCKLCIKWQISPVWLGDLHSICATSLVYIYVSCHYNKDICIVLYVCRFFMVIKPTVYCISTVTTHD